MSPLHLVFSLELRHEIMYIVHFTDTKFVFMAIINDKRYPFSIENIVHIVDQRTLQSFRNRLSQTSFSFSETDTDQSYATVTHRRVDIGKVNILFQIGRHDFGYALGRDCQCFIRFTIRLWNRHVGKISQSLIVNH